jgi:hypothetical protein
LNALRISLARAPKLRLALAAVLLVMGAKYLWSARISDPSLALPGCLYLLGALLFLTYRNYVEIAPGTRRLTRRMGFIHGFTRYSHDIDTISHITLKVVSVKSGKGRSSPSYRLYVNGNAGTALSAHRDFWKARSVAERICRALRVDFDNQRFDVPSVRPAHELDLPLAERWRVRGETKHAPVIGSNSSLTITTDGDTALLIAPNTPISWPNVGIVLLVIAAALVWLASVDTFTLVIALVFGAFTSGFSLLYILSLTGPISLRVTPTAIEYRHGKSPTWQTMPLAEIEELIDENHGLHLMSDRACLTLEHPATPGDQKIQLQFLEHQIALRQPSAGAIHFIRS